MARASVASAALVIAVTSCGDDGPAQKRDRAPSAPEITEVKLPRGTWPRGLTVDENGTLWIAETSADAIAERKPDGELVHHRLEEATETSVGDLVAGGDGNLWFQGFQLVGWITPDGQVSGYQLGFDEDGRPEVGSPEAMTRGPDGNPWYVSEGRQPAVKRITADGLIRTYPLPVRPEQFGVGGITTGGDGALWFTQASESGKGREAIGRLDLQTGYERFPLPHDRSGLGRITTGADGAVWFTESARYAIAKMTADGEVKEFRLKPGTVPADIVAGRDGAIWFTTPHAVGRIARNGGIRTWDVPGSKGLYGIAQDADGALWITDPEADLLRRFEPPST
jgi:virginiamycin B lyase